MTRLVLSRFLETRGAMSAQSLGTQGPLFQEVEVERLDRGCWTITAGLAASGSSRGEAPRTHLCQAFRQGLAWLCLSASPPDSELHFVLCPSPEPSPGPPCPPPSSSACAMPCPGSTGSSAPAADYLVFTLGLWARRSRTSPLILLRVLPSDLRGVCPHAGHFRAVTGPSELGFLYSLTVSGASPPPCYHGCPPTPTLGALVTTIHVTLHDLVPRHTA